jgi:DNA repair exonuclease SbcCD nuclease subunit
MSRRIIKVGDFHMGKFFDLRVHKEFWYKFLKPLCDKNTILLFSGDQFDGDRNITTEFISDVIDLFDDISETVLWAFLMIGNHCTHKHIDIDVNMSKMLNPYPNFDVIKNGEIEAHGIKIGLMSYNHDLNNLVQTLQGFRDDGIEYVMSHADIKELIFDNGSPIEYGLPLDAFAGFKEVWNGHIHRKQEIGNIINLGSPFQMKFSDSKNVCGVRIWDIDTDEVKFVENNISPKYVKLDYAEFLATSPEKFDNMHVWITDVTDVDSARKHVKDVNVLTLRVKFLQDDTEVDSTSEFDYQHDSDPLEETPIFLQEKGAITYKNVHVELDSDRISRIVKEIKELI